MMNILLVEDDEVLGDGLQTVLRQRGYQVEWVRNGIAAMQSLKTNSYDSLLLDLNIPWLSGLAIVSRLRAASNNIPILIITAQTDVPDRVAALDAGADDYLVKPFDVDELCARLRAHHRRLNGWDSPLLQHGDLQVDISSRQATVNGLPIELSATEYEVLRALLENQGKVMTRHQLCETVYPAGDAAESNTIEVHIHNLRKKLGNHPIRTVRGVGYMIEKAK